MTREEIEACVLAGKPIKYGQDGKKNVVLSSERARRVAQVVMSECTVSEPHALKENQAFFKKLEDAFRQESSPGLELTSSSDNAALSATYRWRLVEVLARGFGGLSSHNETFRFEVDAKSWVIEGQNGTGKSSLSNAILFVMTGKIHRDQNGIIENPGRCDPVFDEAGKKIGDWPAIATYPEHWPAAPSTIDVYAELLFVDEVSGERAVAKRHLTGASTSAVITEQIDHRLALSPVLIETALLMPMRIHHIRIAEPGDNQQLVGLIRQLSGLDPLLAVADVADLLTTRQQRFLKYAADEKADTKKVSFSKSLQTATELLSAADPAILPSIDADDVDCCTKCDNVAEDLAARESKALAILGSVAFSGFDAAKAEHRSQIAEAVRSLDADLRKAKTAEGMPAILRDLTALREADGTGALGIMIEAVAVARNDLSQALAWHRRQETDVKLRLKAIASGFVKGGAESIDCPLCERPLDPIQHSTLMEDLEALRSGAEAAQRRLIDACRSIREKVLASGSGTLPQNLIELGVREVRDLVVQDVGARFLEASEIKTQLPGLQSATALALEDFERSIPELHFGVPMPAEAATPDVKLTALLDHLEALAQLSVAWQDARDAYRNAWGKLLNEAEPGSLRELAKKAIAAVEEAEPYRRAGVHVRTARAEAQRYQEIMTRQRLRDAIAEDIRPLKDLRALVNEEAAGTVERLSDDAARIHAKMHNREALAYRGASVQTIRGKQSVGVYARPAASFGPDMSSGWKLDASVLANTSWMRCVLWAFLFAIRNEAVTKLGHCPFSLLLLDDPQLTFDTRNRRSWVNALDELARTGELGSPSQIVITTHDREFASFFLSNDAFQSAGVERCFAPFGCAQIAHIDFAELRYKRAVEGNSDELAKQYIGDLRVICETLLKHAIAEFEPHILYNQNFTLGSLREKIIRPGIKERRAPYNDASFSHLENVMTEDGPVMKLLNEPHHSGTDQITVLQASKARTFWRDRLFPAVKDVWEHFRLNRKRFVGEVESIKLPANCNHKPLALAGLAKLAPQLIGNVSAYSDGRAASGTMGFEAETGEELRMLLGGLGGYMLERDTLSPAAEVGDVLLVHLKPGVNVNNLVVEDRGTHLVARRYEKDPAYPSIAVLTAASANPLLKQNALLTREDGANRRKVAGVIFHEALNLGKTIPLDSDVTPLEADTLAEVLRTSSLLKVLGDSAQPKALDCQYLLVAQELPNLHSACRQLDGCPVVVLDDNDDAYFKRLRYVDERQVAFESLDSSGRGELLVRSLSPDLFVPKRVVSIRAALGVIYDWLGDAPTQQPASAAAT